MAFESKTTIAKACKINFFTKIKSDIVAVLVKSWNLRRTFHFKLQYWTVIFGFLKIWNCRKWFFHVSNIDVHTVLCINLTCNELYKNIFKNVLYCSKILNANLFLPEKSNLCLICWAIVSSCFKFPKLFCVERNSNTICWVYACYALSSFSKTFYINTSNNCR